MSLLSNTIPVTPPNLPRDGLLHTLGVALPLRNKPNKLATNPQLPSDVRVKPLITSRFSEKLRDILCVIDGVIHKQDYRTHLFIFSQGNSVPVRSKSELPDWAHRIEALRKRLALSQAVFSARLGVSSMAVSYWLKGDREPTAENYRKLAVMSPDQELRSYFTDRVFEVSPGLLELVASYARDHQIVSRQREEASASIPLLKDSAAAGNPRAIQDGDIDEILRLPKRWVPHPAATRGIRVEGDSMSPILESGYIVLIDTTPVEMKRLYNQMVAALDPEGGVTIKWLRRVGPEAMLVAQHTSPRYQPVLLNREPGWKIIGRVLFWIGKPK